MNICVNTFLNGKNKMWNLGLVRIFGSMPAEVCLDLLKNRLIAFNLILDSDIVVITTDGPKVMLKVDRLTKAEHQLC